MSKLRNIQDVFSGVDLPKSMENTLKDLMYSPSKRLKRNLSAVVDRLAPLTPLQIQFDLKSNYYTLAKSIFFTALYISLMHELTRFKPIKDGIFLKQLKRYLKLKKLKKRRASGLAPRIKKNQHKIPSKPYIHQESYREATAREAIVVIPTAGIQS